METTLGRLLFNEAFPADFPFVDQILKKRDLTEVDRRARRRPTRGPRWPTSLDNLKDLGFEFATRSGLTISISDIKTPVAKKALLDKFEADAERVEQQYDRGIITDDERRQKEIEIWTEATDKVRDAMQEELRREVQPHRDDGGLGCPRQRHAGASDRRHARSGGQPAW